MCQQVGGERDIIEPKLSSKRTVLSPMFSL